MHYRGRVFHSVGVSFRTALEDRLNLPTVNEVHMVGGLYILLSVFDNFKNINNLSILGHVQILSGERPLSIASYPQLNFEVTYVGY